MAKRTKILACFLVCCLLVPANAWGDIISDKQPNQQKQEDGRRSTVSESDGAQGEPSTGGESELVSPEGNDADILQDDSRIDSGVSPIVSDDEYSDASNVANVVGLAGLFILENFNTDKVVDITAASKANAANVQLYTDNNSPAQRFRIEPTLDGYYSIVNVASGKALDVANGIAQSGANVWQYEQNGSMAQKWMPVENPNAAGSCIFVSALTPEKSTDLAGALVLSLGTEQSVDGANICIRTFDASASQSFRAREITQTISNGIYDINTALDKQKDLDIAGASKLDGANVQILGSNESAAQRFSVIYDSQNGYYTIKNLASGKVLDVAGASTVDGANVQQYESNGTVAQKWSIEAVPESGYLIRSACSGKVLDVQWGVPSDAANVWLYGGNGSAAQLWNFETANVRVVEDGIYTMSSALSESLAVDILGASLFNGGNVQMYPSNNTLAQKFEFIFDEISGYYVIRNVNSGCVLDVAAGGVVNGTNVQQYSSNGTFAQKWAVVSTGTAFVLRSACNGLVLDVSGAQAVSGANVQVWEANGTPAQQWSLSKSRLFEDGIFELRSALGTTLDAALGGEVSGTNIQAYAANGSLAQKYKISFVSDDFYQIECIKSGLLVTAAGGVGSNVMLSQANGSDAQLWKAVGSGDGYCSFLNKLSGAALDIANGSSADGANVQVYASNGSSAQKWQLVSTDVFAEGLYTISSALDQNLVLDIKNGSAQNGAALQLYESNSTAAQKFRVSKVGDDLYRITNLASSKSLDVVDSKIQSSDGSGLVQQWESVTGNSAQLWRFDYAGKGRFSVFSVLADGSSCLDVYGAQAANATPVGVFRDNGSLAQQFKFSEAGTVSYVSYQVTLSQMIEYQKNNPYLVGVTDLELRAVLDPSISSGADYLQFADLRYNSGLTGAQLDRYIGTNGSDGVLSGKGASFVAASQRYGLNEAYLVAHTCLESGWGKSLLAKGTAYNGQGYWYRGTDGKQYWASLPGYEPGTYYNLFGIGAVDSDPNKFGIETAIKNKWNSVEAAIDGSAAWIASGYTYRSSYPQFTLYDMKWDTAESAAIKDRGWHQYATDIQWAKKIARLMNSCYVWSGSVSPTLVYVVPRYV